jgi:glutathionyl-hydroquinone reductase
MIPRSYGLIAAGGYHPGQGSSIAQPENQPQQYSQVVESLFDNLEFIQAKFDISQFVTAAVDTEADWANTKVLYSALETTLTHLDITIL